MKKRVRTMRRAIRVIPLPIIILAAGALVAGAILLAPKPKATSTTSQQPVPTLADVSNCSTSQNQFKCFADYFTAKTKATEALEAIKDLKQLYETDAFVKSQCHQFTHAIGHEAYYKYGTLAGAYTKGDSFCWSGYYHGITEQAIGELGPERMRKEANQVCEELAKKQKYSFDHYNCAHGLGHGFMTVESFDLFKALKTCDLLRDEWERKSCYGGVFMENVMVAVRESGQSKYLRPAEPMYPCTAVEKVYKEQCYLMQTSYALQQTSYDFGRVAKLCQDLPDTDFVSTCYQSLGRDASGSTVSDIPKTKENCEKALDGVGLEPCVLGAVRDFISFHHSDTQAKELCNAFDQALAARCLEEVKTYYATF
ncbi:MAG TPA: hypothetical protein VK694_06030 [Verrucomicrobiae bacterium]|nr:hypothetical protein [Verrucomicrobiae bacterium]